MNHIYKVIFCKATGTFVAVAEFARAHVKKGSGTVGSVVNSESGQVGANNRYAMGLSGLTTLSAAIFLSLGLSSTAFAAIGSNSIDTRACTNSNDTVANRSNGDIAIGCGSDASGSQAIAIGFGASTKIATNDKQGDQGIAIGSNSKVTGAQGIAIGNDAQTTGNQSVAFGANTRASGDSSIAIGGDDVNKVIIKSGAKYTEITGITLKENDYKNTESLGAGSVAVGVQAISSGDFSTATGMTALS